MKFPFLDAKARLVRIMVTFDLATGHGDTMDALLDSLESELRNVLGYYRQRREWVGLTEDEQIKLVQKHIDSPVALLFEAEAKLKEKNT